MNEVNTMRQNTQNMMMTPASISGSQQLASVVPTMSATVMTASTTSVQENREQPESRHLCKATGEMFPIGFGIRRELFNLNAIIAAVYRPDGLEITRKRISDAFFAQWGSVAAKYEADHLGATQELQRLENEYVRVGDELKETPLTRTVNGYVLPSGAALWGFWGLVVALFALNGLALTNAASYFRFQAQGWGLAVLMAAPLLFVSLPVKFVCGKLREVARVRVGWSLACLGVVSFIVFVFTLSTRANPPSTADILDGAARLGTGLIPWQLASQVVLEFVMATALWYWILELMASNSKIIPNPDAELLKSRLAALHTAMNPVRERFAFAKGNLQELRSSLDYWLQSAETIYMTHLERNRRLEECLVSVNNWVNS